MVTDQDLAKEVETLLRQSDPNAITSLNGVIQQLGTKLGLDLSHKAGFIRDQINFLLRAHPTTQTQTQTQPQLQSRPQTLPQPQQQQQQLQPLPQQQQLQHHSQGQLQTHHVPSKDHFAPHHQLQYSHQAHQFSPHFSVHHQLHTNTHHQDLNFCQPQPTMPSSHPQQQINQKVTQQGLVQKFEPVFPQNVAGGTVSFETPAKESAPVAGKRRGGPGGLNKVCGVSPELQVIVGEPALPRTEIVKQLWAYIRKNNLQDPSNKRKIICDDALRVVFETDCTDMFKMNKLLSKHIIALEPRKDSSQAKRLKVEVKHTTENKEPVSSPVIISEALAKFFGVEEREMLDAEVVRRVWEYVKSNHLEDPLNSMVILCDEKLSGLLGCDSISAVGITEMLRGHLFKPS